MDRCEQIQLPETGRGLTQRAGVGRGVVLPGRSARQLLELTSTRSLSEDGVPIPEGARERLQELVVSFPADTH